MALIASVLQPELNQIFYALTSRPKCWIVIFFVLIIALLPNYVYVSWKQFNPALGDNLIMLKLKEKKRE